MGAFGGALRKWRQLRRLSQLDLALEAGVSARHVSFLETGRAQPSRGMVLRLGEPLQLPPAALNHMLISAGLAPVYGRRELEDAELAPLWQAAERILERHAPYPAMVVDRQWRLLRLNRPAEQMLSVTGLALGDSLIEALLDNAVLRAALDNLSEVERHSLARLRTELAHVGSDPVLEHAIERLQRNVQADNITDAGLLPAVIPARYRMGPQLLSFFSTITQFGGTGDVLMSELRIEQMFPADDASRIALEQMAGGGNQSD